MYTSRKKKQNIIGFVVRESACVGGECTTWISLEFSSRPPWKKNFPVSDEMRPGSNAFKIEKRKESLYPSFYSPGLHNIVGELED